MIIYILQARGKTANVEDWFDTVLLFPTEEEAKQFAIGQNYEDYMIYPRNYEVKK